MPRTTLPPQSTGRDHMDAAYERAASRCVRASRASRRPPNGIRRCGAAPKCRPGSTVMPWSAASCSLQVVLVADQSPPTRTRRLGQLGAQIPSRSRPRLRAASSPELRPRRLHPVLRPVSAAQRSRLGDAVDRERLPREGPRHLLDRMRRPDREPDPPRRHPPRLREAPQHERPLAQLRMRRRRACARGRRRATPAYASSESSSAGLAARARGDRVGRARGRRTRSG